MIRIHGVADNHLLTPPSVETDPFEVISEKDYEKADQEMVKEMFAYAGWTALSVFIVLLIIFCFASDPRACVVAFGTGSPCCLLCPCIKSLYKYTNPAKLLQGSANKYIPGIIIQDDGKIEAYEPSQEEMDTLMELVNEFMK